MIKKYTLAFDSSEVEQTYRNSQLMGLKHRRELALGIICIILILLIIKLNQDNNLLLQIIVGIGFALELAVYFVMKRYWEKKEIFISINIVIIAVVSETLRLFGSQSDQWFIGYHFSILKLIIYLQGNVYILQTLIYLSAHGASLYSFNNYNTYAIIIHWVLAILPIALRYQYEFTNKQCFLAKLSKDQYENIIEGLLPSWVVILKYDKLSAQLQIDKINSKMKEKFDLKNHSAFREFLRKLTIIPNEQENQNQYKYIKFEQELISILKQKDVDRIVEKYNAQLEKNSQDHKEWKFQITQVYFKAFEPHVLLLFEELKEGKYDQLTTQIEQRDQSSYSTSRICIQKLVEQYQLIQKLHFLIKNLFQGNHEKQEQMKNIFTNLKKQVQIGQALYNINLNLFNIFKITYHQLHYELDEMDIEKFVKQICNDFALVFKESHLLFFPLQQYSVIKTDKRKLISIVINLVEFIKILLSITQNNQNLLYEVNPMGYPITISVKNSKKYSDCMKITLSHQKLFLDQNIVNQIQNIQQITLDNKKRNWGQKNYFQSMHQLNLILKQMLEFYKKDFKSTSLIENDSIGKQTSQLFNVSQDCKLIPSTSDACNQFNTLGYIIAQYLISQLGPCNRINFKQHSQNDGYSPLNYQFRQQQTKIEFFIYQDMNNFMKQITYQEQQNILVDLYMPKRKYTSSEISSRLLQFVQIANSKKYL